MYKSKIDFSKNWDGVNVELFDSGLIGKAISREMDRREFAEIVKLIGDICLKHENDSHWYALIEDLIFAVSSYTGVCSPTRRNALMMLVGYTAGHFDACTTNEARDEMLNSVISAKHYLSKLNDHEG
jgi:hypothetical protein|nr:MAG TPA: hypothetical protein [Caudoviricetes sp.]